MYVRVWIVYVNGHVFMCTYVHVCWLCVTVMWICSYDSNLVTEDPDPIWIYAHYEPDSQVIQRPTYKMIRRFVSVHAVKTRRQFKSKIASFHMSVYFYIIATHCYKCTFYLLSLNNILQFKYSLIHLYSHMKITVHDTMILLHWYIFA